MILTGGVSLSLFSRLQVNPILMKWYVTGVAGKRPFPGGYLASGAISALEGLTRGLAVDLAPIRVNLVCPGMVSPYALIRPRYLLVDLSHGIFNQINTEVFLLA